MKHHQYTCPHNRDYDSSTDDINIIDCLWCLHKILGRNHVDNTHKKVLLRIYEIERIKDYKVEFDDLLK
jgi:hypothetical protein